MHTALQQCALAGQAGLRDGGVRHPVGLPEGYHTAARGQSFARSPAVAPRAAPGPTRGRALPGRRDDARAPAWFGGANPERTAKEPLTRSGTRQQERAAQDACGNTGRHQPDGGIHLDTVEVTGSIPVSPTTETAWSRLTRFRPCWPRNAWKTTRSSGVARAFRQRGACSCDGSTRSRRLRDDR